MKKLATVLMLVAAILVGGMTMEAKTIKKKTKAKTTRTSKKYPTSVFGIKTFLERSNGEWWMKPSYDLKKNLLNMGFTIQPSKYDSNNLPAINDENNNILTVGRESYPNRGEYGLNHIVHYEKDGINVYSLFYSSNNKDSDFPYDEEVLIVFPNETDLNQFISGNTILKFKRRTNKEYFKADYMSSDGRFFIDLLGQRTLRMTFCQCC